jgi:predicted TIM-barrel fold metal-dependent hydrolase
MDHGPVVDCHVHVFDPVRFPYRPDTFYAPSGQELGTPARLGGVLDAHGVEHALLVGPNSGYGEDNRCPLDAVAAGAGRYRGMAAVPIGTAAAELAALAAAGVVGITVNAALLGTDFYADAGRMLADLAELDLIADVQVTGGQLLVLSPLLERSGVRVVVDHCGRPDPAAGLDAPGFRELLRWGRSGRAVVKLSGCAKVSRESYPHTDVLPYVRALVDDFGPDRCVWGSDWPFLRMPERIDYGPLLALLAEQVPDDGARRRILWDTPCREFGFPGPDQ